MLRPALVSLLLAPWGALAQPLPPEPAPDQAPAPLPLAAPAAPAALALPGLNPAGMSEFLSHYLSYDEAQGQAFEGRGRAPVERDRFYQVVGRPDLAEGVHQRQLRKRLLYIGAAATALAGLGGGLAFFASAPNLDSAACQDRPDHFQACASKRETLQAGGRASLIGGALGAGVLTLLGLTVDLDPVPRAEAHRLANEYNGALRRRLTEGSAREAAGRTLSLAPVAAPGAGGLVLALRY